MAPSKCPSKRLKKLLSRKKKIMSRIFLNSGTLIVIVYCIVNSFYGTVDGKRRYESRYGRVLEDTISSLRTTHLFIWMQSQFVPDRCVLEQKFLDDMSTNESKFLDDASLAWCVPRLPWMMRPWTIGPRTIHRPGDASSRGRIVQGTHRTGDASSRGRIVQGTHLSGDASSKNFRSWIHRSRTHCHGIMPSAVIYTLHKMFVLARTPTSLQTCRQISTNIYVVLTFTVLVSVLKTANSRHLNTSPDHGGFTGHRTVKKGYRFYCPPAGMSLTKRGII